MFKKLFTWLNRGHCTMWPDKMFGIDYSLACLAHDMEYLKRSFWLKVKSDIALTLDVWAVASIADRWWKRWAIRANAVVMGIGVGVFGWFLWAPKWINLKLDQITGKETCP